MESYPGPVQSVGFLLAANRQENGFSALLLLAKKQRQPFRAVGLTHWEGVCIPSPMAAVETPAFRPGFNLRTALKGGVSNRSLFQIKECWWTHGIPSLTLIECRVCIDSTIQRDVPLYAVVRRLRVTVPTTPSPTSNMAQVSGSGMGA